MQFFSACVWGNSENMQKFFWREFTMVGMEIPRKCRSGTLSLGHAELNKTTLCMNVVLRVDSNCSTHPSWHSSRTFRAGQMERCGIALASTSAYFYKKKNNSGWTKKTRQVSCRSDFA